MLQTRQTADGEEKRLTAARYLGLLTRFCYPLFPRLRKSRRLEKSAGERLKNAKVSKGLRKIKSKNDFGEDSLSGLNNTARARRFRAERTNGRTSDSFEIRSADLSKENAVNLPQVGLVKELASFLR